ncbi:hypothetical protein [Marinobacter sp.]|uniref:putative PDDEXK endonuclease n=1 Tax=Marinobacter sp. TaxID=50741 RepID=UPI000C9907E8|nr:hypothetical protein [Marinobacter sp.]MAB51374.1 hypothetical protein [Marinobacter sp.]|tara:strand:+ start:154 stop:603 length:450 start_codon:yes stop_codon:yes gene_type:complete
MRAGGGRAKGAAFERFLAKEFELELGSAGKCQRNLEQYQKKNLSDLTFTDPRFPFLVEAKRYKDSVSPSWWDQIVTAARTSDGNPNDCLPCLIWKLDRQDISVRIPIEALARLGRPLAQDVAEAYDWRYTATLSWPDFIMVCRDLMARE